MAKKITSRLKRKIRIRKKIKGSEERPRLCIYKSNKHIYASIINDNEQKVITSASSLSPEVRENIKTEYTKTDISKMVGKLIAKRAIEKGIKKIVFDRNGFTYTGRIASLADAAREEGLLF